MCNNGVTLIKVQKIDMIVQINTPLIEVTDTLVGVVAMGSSAIGNAATSFLLMIYP